MNKNQLLDNVRRLIEPTIKQLGYDIQSLSFRKEEAYEGAQALDVTISKSGGITIDDCVKVTKAINPLLDEEDIIPFSYVLEVSSPGISDEAN